MTHYMVLFFAVLIVLMFAGAVLTRRSIRQKAEKEAYWAAIREAEKEHWNLVYGKYIHA